MLRLDLDSAGRSTRRNEPAQKHAAPAAEAGGPLEYRYLSVFGIILLPTDRLSGPKGIAHEQYQRTPNCGVASTGRLRRLRRRTARTRTRGRRHPDRLHRW